MTAVHRPLCSTCLRPQRTCICQWITPTPNPLDVVILQHPLEVAHAKGTARLLHLSLQRSTLAVGETWEATALHALLYEPLAAVPKAEAPQHTILLYPDTPHDPALGLSTPPPLPPALMQEPARVRLIVLDGTWRKSRKMLYCNTLLQRLPRLALKNLPASNYHIRKAQQAHQLSTLEATCMALAQLGGSTAPYAPLLAAFDGFVTQQQAYQAGA